MTGRRSRQRGFLLLDVMVALAIAALALVALFGLMGAGVTATDLARDRLLATRLAQSRLAALGVSEPLVMGRWELGGEHGFAVWASVRPVSRPPVGPALVRIDIDVLWRQGRQPHRLRLSTLRLAPADARK